jgi:16S rRNA processing protein RimM
MLTGFTISDIRAGQLGIVSEVDDSSANTLLIVATAEGEEIILPVHPDLVEKIDLNDRTLTLNLPEGLVE